MPAPRTASRSPTRSGAVRRASCWSSRPVSGGSVSGARISSSPTISCAGATTSRRSTSGATATAAAVTPSARRSTTTFCRHRRARRTRPACTSASRCVGLSMGGSIAAPRRWRRGPSCHAARSAMISSPADLRALRPKPWRIGALRQVRLRHALRVPASPRRRCAAASRARPRRSPRLPVPKLIVTSEGDWLVDPSHGRALAEGLGEARGARPPGSAGVAPRRRPRRAVPVRLLRVLDRWFADNAPPD